jgi:flagellar assembly factor FliW
MLVNTKYFGQIDLDEDKVLTFDNGIMGFEDYKKYTILYNIEDEGKGQISWLQSLDESTLALPVISPALVKEDYNPIIEDEVLKHLGELNDDNTAVLLALTVPGEVKKTTVNLKAPIIINSDTRKGCQIIAENQEYVVKYNVYEVMKERKKNKGVE